ncbi:nucleotidyl transferase AbiEii/AbiGii toxin family protein [Polaromonas sp. YR568]|uniref:nucleotidyl transferase AbiEii/AbiGii toxin family protein n=1 Tax=Polaromonas sp. YR568 TaxID=1855301 RepID=UPI00398BDB6F
MTPISFDFSTRPELLSLAHIARDLQAVAEPMGIEFFLMGAMARDLMLLYTHGINTGRQTKDADFSVMVRDWEAFSALRAGLVETGAFLERPGPATHRLHHVKSGLPLDIVPFGAIERADRTIAWPPKQQIVLDCFGLREAFDASLSVLLPEGVRWQVASIPALALLKVAAWKDRHQEFPGKDAGDLVLHLRHYLDCGNLERAGVEPPDLFEVDDYHHEATSARLLGRDVAVLLDAQSRKRVLEILRPEADEGGPLILAGQSGPNLEQARQLIQAVCDGLADRR